MKKKGMIRYRLDTAVSEMEKEQSSRTDMPYVSSLPNGIGIIESEKHFDLRNLMIRINKNMTSYTGGGNILTDDRAPVELLGMGEIDKLISKELSYYKKIFEEEGFGGLIRAVG
ncbi:MAG: hypothetical protein J6P16_01310 [Eubacterium sp.]|nr:hypothetical protein [Eubacterium sp.]